MEGSRLMPLLTDAEPKPEEQCAYVYHRGRDGELVCGRERISKYHHPHSGDGHFESVCSHHSFISLSAAEATKAGMPNSEAPMAGLGAAPATPASAVKSSAAETNECAACAETSRLRNAVEERRRAGDRKTYVYLSDPELHHVLIARLRAENGQLRAAVVRLLDHLGGTSMAIPIDAKWWDRWMAEARRALTETKEPSG